MAENILRRALEEAKGAYISVTLLSILINTLIVFLISLLISSLIRFSWFYSLIPTIIYAAIAGRGCVKNFRFGKVEADVPELKEQLRTVADNVGKKNEILDMLNQDVLGKMRFVKSSRFFDSRKIMYKTVAIAVLSLVIGMVSFWNVHFIDAGLIVQGLLSGNLSGLGSEKKSLDLSKVEEGNLSDIFGKSSIAELGTEQLDLKVNTVDSGIDINDVKDAEKRQFEEQQLSEGIKATSDASYQEKIKKEYQEYVKKYFDKITKEGEKK